MLDAQGINDVPRIGGKGANSDRLHAPFAAADTALVETDRAHVWSQFFNEPIPEAKRSAKSADQDKSRAAARDLDPGSGIVAERYHLHGVRYLIGKN